jgi:hypothetical protein
LLGRIVTVVPPATLPARILLNDGAGCLDAVDGVADRHRESGRLSVCVAWSIVMPMTDGRSVSWRFVSAASGGEASPPYFAFAAPCISGQIELRMRERT